MSEDDVLAVWTTWPDRAHAQAAARAILGAKLAACANLYEVTSVYRWEGAIEESAECGALFKTTRANATALRNHVLAMHPYAVPCVTAWQVDASVAHGAYLEWVRRETEQP